MKYKNSISLRIQIIGVLIIILVNIPIFVYSQEADSLAIGKAYFEKANKYFGSNSDSVYYYVKKSSEIFLNGEHWEDYINTLNAYCSYYDIKNDFEKRRQYALLAFEESAKYLSKSNTVRAFAIWNHSQALLDIGNYTLALENFKQVLEIEKINKENDFIPSSLKIIGNIYNDLGDLDQAIEYYDESFYFESNHPGSMNTQNELDILRNRGIAYLKKNNLKKAISDLKKAYSILPRDKIQNADVNHLLAVEINYSVAEIYLKTNNLDSLNYYVQNAFKYCIGDYVNDKDLGYLLLGKYHLKNKNIDEAIINFIAAEKYKNQKYKNFAKHIKISELHNYLGNAHLLNNDNKKALSYFKKAITNLALVGIEDDESYVPVVENLYNPYTSMKAYEGLGAAYYNLFNETNDTDYLKASNLSFEISTNQIFEVRKTYQQDNSLLRFSEEVLYLYESAIESTLKMYDISRDKNLLTKAFNYNEKSKAILLLESINEQSAIQFSIIPDSLLLNEEDLKRKISTLNRKIYDLQNNLDGQNEIIFPQLKQQLFKDKEAYEVLINKFENLYPDYYKLKYDNSIVSIEDIQLKLQNTNRQLIEFFYGDQNIYVFSISKNDLTVNKIPRSVEIDTEIQKINNFISSPPSSNNIDLELKDYIRCSTNIYDALIKISILPNTDHIIFITDGPLGYLPFEALVTTNTKLKNISFSLDNLSYLIEDYQVSYSYSSTLFLNSFKSDGQEAKSNFFGVAPSFDRGSNSNTRICNENTLFSLQCSEEEVLKIKGLLGGKVLIGNDATLVNTKNEISNSKIIHLATHACLDDNNPEFNKIYLTDDYLSNNDLYNLKLKGDLAVLSACETGSGRLAKGEGVMSVARGFIHAGCPSVVMSLWSIDDCATSKIMIDFYNELYKGKTKTEALRNAKLNYVREAKKANQHPYYWAAFVQIGNYNPIKFSSSKNYLLYLSGVLLIVLILVFFKKNNPS